jgi:hypothetical protein
MSVRAWIVLLLVVVIVLLLTPFDEILILAAFAIGGILGVLVLVAIIVLLFAFVFRHTRWGGAIWSRAERQAERIVSKWF